MSKELILKTARRKRRKMKVDMIAKMTAIILIISTIIFCYLRINSFFKSNQEEHTTIEYGDVQEQEEPCKEEETTIQWEAYEFIPLDGDIQKEIYEICCEYEISYELILSIIDIESRFDVNALGDNGNSVGLMQIQPRWWQSLADENGLDIYDPVDNVHIGIMILSTLLEENGGDLEKALKQYNTGDPNSESDYYTKIIFEKCEDIERRKNDKDTILR